LGWPVKPTGRIEYSEFRFFAPTVQDRFRPLNVPTIQEALLQISVDAGSDLHITELAIIAPPVPIQLDYAFGLAVPALADCSRIFSELTRVSDNLFRPLGRTRSDGKNYRSQNLRQGKLEFDQRPEGAGYKKSFSERRNDSGGVSRQAMTVWDHLFPLLQPPPFDLKSQQQILLPAELLPHQPEGIHFLASREAALLGDGVQTGKTIESVVAMKFLFQSGRIESALIVCPIPLLIHWQKQLEKWAPELWQGLSVVRSSSKEQRRLMWRMPVHVYAVNYETMVSDLEDILIQRREKGLGLVVADEVQRIKNPGTEVAKALKELGKLAKHRWGLSATPLENKVEDLVSIFEFLKPGLLRRDAESEHAVQLKIKPHFLRRRTADVLKHFKEPRHDNYFVEMEGEQLEAYEAAFRESVAELRRMGERVTLTHALAKLQALKQLCNVHLASECSAKADWLVDTLEEITANGDKALVFSQYIECGRNFLEKRLQRLGCVNYGRATTDGQRRAAVKSFGEDPKKKVFVANPMTAGVGMPDLKEANYVIHFDHWWNPAIIDQANGRILGYGQKKEAFIVHLWVENSIEARIQAILSRKRGLFERVIDSQTSVGGTGLTEDELFQVFGLAPPPRTATARATPDTQRPTPNQRQGTGVWTKQDLEALSPPNFEDLTVKLYKAMGFAAQRTKQSRDEGIDVVAIRDLALGRDKLAIQCKHQSRPVGRPDLQKLLGVVSSDSSFSAGILITTSSFSADARRFVERNARLRLIDRTILLALLIEHCKR
jgi:superfamily II DNA or RNA helicase